MFHLLKNQRNVLPLKKSLRDKRVTPYTMRWLSFICSALLVANIWAQDIAELSYITGTVFGENEPLIGVQVWVDGMDKGDVTDSLGWYQLGPLSDGIYQLVFQHIGYKKEMVGPVTIISGQQVILDFHLTQSAVEMEAILVTPKEEGFDPTGVTARLSTRMIREAPGAAQDIFLVLQTLPGVSSGGDDSKLYVRGGRPEENLVIYDGATIPNPFHFDFIGGGFYSIFNSNLVEKVEFYSGGFPARYGDRLSAVMVIENREGNRNQRGSEISLSMADVTGLVESPLSDKATTILTFRRSYFDLLLSKSGFGGKYDLLPFFYDMNSKTDIFFSERHRLSINLLYSREKMIGEFDEPHWEGTHKWSSESWTTALRLRSLFSEKIVSDLNIYWSEGTTWASHADDVGTENTRKGELAIKEDLAIHTDSHEYHMGFWVVQDRGDMEIKLPVDLAYNFEPLFFKLSGNALKLAAYLEDTWKANSWLSLNYGIRSDYIVPSDETVLSPRLNVVIMPSENLQLSANYGWYSQSPPGYELKNNPLQQSSQSKAWGLGVNGKTISDIYWNFEVYRKQFSRLMVIDSVGNFSNEGKGQAIGYELYIQKRTGDKFIGWTSFTYSVSKRKERTASEVTLFDYDQTYMMSTVLQYRPTDMWQLSVRFRYATGRPFTPAEGGWIDNETGRYFPYVGERNSSRYPPYHRLDFRIARHFPQWLKGTTVYLETINTYNRDNVAYYVWSEDFSDKQNFTVFPFIPVLGVDIKL